MSTTKPTQLVIRKLQPRHIEAVLASEYPVDRYGEKEVLIISPEAVNLERFPLPLLVSHDTQQLPIGVATNPRFEDRKLVADLLLADNDEADEIYERIRDGILNNLSIGYKIDRQQETASGKRVTRFTPHEVSLVSVPADPQAKITQVRVMDNASPYADSEDLDMIAIARRHSAWEEYEETKREGLGIDELRHKVLNKVSSVRALPDRDIGMSNREIEQFSVAKAIRAMADNDWKDAGLEREVLRTTEKLRTRQNSFVLPNELMRRDVLKSGTGGELVGVQFLGDRFIDALYTESDVLNRCTLLSGLTQDVAIPRMTSSSSSAWYAEGGTIAESTPAFDQLTLSANTLASMVEYSRKLLRQSDVEQILRRDMSRTMAIALDTAILNGSGSGAEPTGILQTSGIGAVAGGTNGAAPTYDNMVDLIAAVAEDNARSDNSVFISNSKVEAKLRKTSKVSSTDSVMVLENGQVAGRDFIISNAMPSNLTKGTGSGLSAILFGDLREVIVGMFGDLEIVVDPHTKLNENLLRIASFMEVDLGLRHVESFAAMNDAITS
jgi:HK97 family phage major capsid protein/HK97 family phage prohead protease